MKEQPDKPANAGSEEEALAAKLRRVVPALREIPMRTSLLMSELSLAGRDVRVSARALDLVASAAEQADPASREVIAALLPALSDASLAAFVNVLRTHAEAFALLALSRLLRRRQLRGTTKEKQTRERRGAETRGIALEPGGRPLSLGERRALARAPSRAILDKLLADPHPFVIRNLLQNPRLTEDDVVRMAARRPGKPWVIVEIASSAVWIVRARVRMAIVLNPVTPPEISVPMLSQLVRSELTSVQESTLVPAILRSAALDLLARRPPPPPDRMGSGNMQ